MVMTRPSLRPWLTLAWSAYNDGSRLIINIYFLYLELITPTKPITVIWIRTEQYIGCIITPFLLPDDISLCIYITQCLMIIIISCQVQLQCLSALSKIHPTVFQFTFYYDGFSYFLLRKPFTAPTNTASWITTQQIKENHWLAFSQNQWHSVYLISSRPCRR